MRFPSRAEDEEELLLEVSPFPEERLASSLASSLSSNPASSLKSSLASSPGSQPRQVTSAVSPQAEVGSLARPLSLEASLHGVVAGQQKPRLHLPRTSDQRSLGRVPSVTKPRPRPQAAGAVRPAFEDAAPPPLVAKTKVITNPLLQKLFNRNSLHLAATTVRPPPTTTTTTTARPRPAPRQSEATTPRAVTRQPRPQTQRTTTSPPPQQQQQTLFDQIKNRINNNNVQQQRQQQEEQSEEDLMNALIQQRVEEELQRRRDQEAARLDQQRRRLLDQTRLSAEAAARLARYEALVAAAAEAVTARVSGATDRASPAVWAATRALRSFVDSRSGDTAAEAANTPDKVLAAVAQLTSFLGRDQGEVSLEAEEVSRAQLETFMRGEGRGQSEAALQKVAPEPAASPQFPLLRQFEASLASKQVTLNIASERGVRQPPELGRTSGSDLAKFSFSTLPV